MIYRILLPALCLLACNSGPGDTEDPTAPSSTSTSTPTSGEPAICDDYRSEPLGSSVKITVRNKTSGPIWVSSGSCAAPPSLKIVDPADPETNHFSDPSRCTPSACQDFFGVDECNVTCDECQSTIATRMERGGSIVVDWPGGHDVEMKLDPACADGSRCAFTSCSRSVRALPAVYALSLTAEVDCIDNCECEPSSAGWCAIQGDSITYLSNEIEALAVIDYPTDTAVELVFN